METRILKPTPQDLEEAIHILRQGGIGVFPTDTVYGLGASILSDKAVERVYQVKGRPRHLALPILLASVSQIGQVTANVPPLAWLLAEKFLPGGFSLVLPRGPVVSDLVAGGGNTVAVRVPRHPIPQALIQGLGAPIVGTSANLSGQPAPVAAQEVARQLSGQVDFIFDGGRCPGGRESTIIDLTCEPPRLLREGAIPWETIQKAMTQLATGLRQ